MHGVYGVFSVQAYMPHDPEREVRQGQLVADAAHAANVEHMVYSSAAGANRQIGIPETDSKWQIEQHIRTLGLPATILRPTYFMENLEFQRTWIQGGTFSMPLASETTVQMIAADDIGAFARLAFDRPMDFVGRSIEIAGDELTMLQVARTLERSIGRAVTFAELPMEQARGFDPNLAKLCEWMRTHSCGADLSSLRALHPDLLTLERWLSKAGWSGPHSSAASPGVAS